MVKSLMRGRLQFCALCWLLVSVGHMAVMTPRAVAEVDTDGDGLLDVLDVRGFDPNASGSVFFNGRYIEDLDGANQLTEVQHLALGENRITSIERGDFSGLTNLLSLSLSWNGITSIENGVFRG